MNILIYVFYLAHEDAVYMVCVQKIALFALKRNLLFHVMRNVLFTMTSQKKLIIYRKLRHNQLICLNSNNYENQYHLTLKSQFEKQTVSQYV